MTQFYRICSTIWWQATSDYQWRWWVCCCISATNVVPFHHFVIVDVIRSAPNTTIVTQKQVTVV